MEFPTRLFSIAALLFPLSLALSTVGCSSTPPQNEEPEETVEVVSTGEAGAETEGSDEDFDEFEEFEEEFGEEAGVQEEVFDPLMTVNRGIYQFNDFFYCRAWRPAAVGYARIVPEQVRIAIARAYNNFRTPPHFGNSLLQLKFKKAGLELGRLIVNSTIGIVGFFDPADSFFGWRDPSEEDFGQTLAYWGVGEGFPIVFPLLGPSNLRDGLGIVSDSFAHPIVYFVPGWVTVSVASGYHFNRSSLKLGQYESFKREALDPYTFFRDLYQQNRQKEIGE